MKMPPTFVFTQPGKLRGELVRRAFGYPLAQWTVTRRAQFAEALARVTELQTRGKWVAVVLSYEAAPGFDKALATHEPGLLPLGWFAAFDEPAEFESASDSFTLDEPHITSSVAEYAAAVRKILSHIRAGDIYQANFTVRAQCAFSGNAYAAYCTLTDAVPMPYSAYVDTGAVQIVSLSPELFLARRGDTLFSQPMKGTAPRRPSWDADEAERVRLARSEKDRAENTMIVDLMRNDLGRVCEAGSVRVEDAYTVLRLPTVHQMISTVKGTARPGVSLHDILCATFPAGSITGAPKVRATEIIRANEATPRGIYCGSIGLFEPGGDFTMNVAIRTLEISGARATLGIGSGIVADSNPEREWDEVLLKGQFATRRPRQFALYETFRWEPEIGFQKLHRHLQRLRRSCEYFARPFPLNTILNVLRELKPKLGQQPNRVRLDVEHEQVSYQLIPEELGWPEEVVVMIPDARVDPLDARLYHKTTLRPEKTLARQKAKMLGAEECLFLNTSGEFTEGSISNFTFNVSGEWLTPAIRCGLLPGVWRDAQVSSGFVREGVIRIEDLEHIEGIQIGNSVRGSSRVVRIILEDGTEVYRARKATA